MHIQFFFSKYFCFFQKCYTHRYRTESDSELLDLGCTLRRSVLTANPGMVVLRNDDQKICDLTLLLQVFQSHQGHDKVIMKGCVQWNPVYDCKDFCLEWVSNLGLLDQQASS